MISNIKDIQYILDVLTKTENIYPEPVGEELSSDNFNQSFGTIEYQLNRLYEKTRLLEELNEFTRQYIEREIEPRKEIFKERMKIIEDVSDAYRDTDYVAILVKFTPCNEIVKDRDGTVLTHMDTSHHNLDAPGEILKEAILKSITPKSDEILYENSYNELLNKKAGMSTYITEWIIKGGLNEITTATLKNPDYYNYVSVTPVNSKLVNLKIINGSSSEEMIATDSSYLEYKYITGIKFKLNCKNYEVKQISIKHKDYEAIKDFTKKNDLYDKLLKQDSLIVKEEDLIKKEDEMITKKIAEIAEKKKQEEEKQKALLKAEEDRKKKEAEDKAKESQPKDEKIEYKFKEIRH